MKVNLTNIIPGTYDPVALRQFAKLIEQSFDRITVPEMFLQAGTGAVVRTAQNKARDIVNVKDFGATGDGATDDITAIQAALDSGAKRIYLPGGNYRTTATINMNSVGQVLCGASRSTTSILADFRGGAVIAITMARCRVSDLAVSTLAGSARRNASPLNVTPPSTAVDGNSTDRGINLYETVAITNLLTYTKIERVDVVYQPGDGIAMGGAGSGTIIEQCGVSYCGGHGMYFDDGDRDGTAKTRNGIVDIRDCVIQQCWGHGVALATESALTVFRFNLHNLDIFDNCLGDGGTDQPTFFNSAKSAIAGKMQNSVISQCGVMDVNGIQLSSSVGVVIDSVRFVTITTTGFIVNTGCSRIKVLHPYFSSAPTLGFRINATCDNVSIDGVVSSEYASATAIIDAESETYISVDGRLCKTIAGSNSLWYDEEIKSATIASSICNIQSNMVQIIGEGDLADTVSIFRFVTGVEVPDGYKFSVHNWNAYNIIIGDMTVFGGAANIELQGVSAVLEPDESLSFVVKTGVYYAIGREFPVSVAHGGTGRVTSTTAYGLIAAGTTATGAHQTLAAGATTEIIVGGGASALPVWTTATGTGAPVRAGSPSFTTAVLGDATMAVFNTVSTTVNAFGAATTLNIGNASGTNTISGATRFNQSVGIGVAASSTIPLGISTSITATSGSPITINVATTNNAASPSTANIFGIVNDVSHASSSSLTGLNCVFGRIQTISGGTGAVASGRAFYARIDLNDTAAFTGLSSYETLTTLDAASTITDLWEYRATAVSNAGVATVTQHTVFDTGAQTVGTTIFGFRGQIAAAANRWNLYMSGTALNYLAGTLLVGTATETASAGLIQLATGTTAASGILAGTDTNLYRGAANTWKTDDSFVVAGTLSVETLPAYVAGDRYVTIPAAGGGFHLSAIGPGS